MFDTKKLTSLLSKQKERLEAVFGKDAAKGINDNAEKEMAKACAGDRTRKLRCPKRDAGTDCV